MSAKYAHGIHRGSWSPAEAGQANRRSRRSRPLRADSNNFSPCHRGRCGRAVALSWSGDEEEEPVGSWPGDLGASAAESCRAATSGAPSRSEKRAARGRCAAGRRAVRAASSASRLRRPLEQTTGTARGKSRPRAPASPAVEAASREPGRGMQHLVMWLIRRNGAVFLACSPVVRMPPELVVPKRGGRVSPTAGVGVGYNRRASAYSITASSKEYHDRLEANASVRTCGRVQQRRLNCGFGAASPRSIPLEVGACSWRFSEAGDSTGATVAVPPEEDAAPLVLLTTPDHRSGGRKDLLVSSEPTCWCQRSAPSLTRR